MAQEPLAAVTILTKSVNNGIAALLSKRIALSTDGRPVSDGSPCHMSRGSAISIPAPATLASTINTLEGSQALALGTVRAGIGVRKGVVTLDTLRKLPEAQRKDLIARARQDIDYQAGVPGWALIDYDTKGLPTNVATAIEAAGGVWQALVMVAPGLAGAARVSRASTSAGIYRADTGERFPGSGGEHHYFLAQDGSDINRALKDLHERCWLHGLGWCVINAAGHINNGDPAISRAAIERARTDAGDLLLASLPAILPVRHDGSLYRARLMGLSHERAAAACDRLAAAGFDCFTVPPGS